MQKHMRNNYIDCTVNYIPKPLPMCEVYTFKIHSLNKNTLMADVEIFRGGVSFLRKDMDKNEYREWENKVYQSQKLY